MLKHSLARRQSLWLVGAALVLSLAITPLRVWMAARMIQSSEQQTSQLRTEQLALRIAMPLRAAESIAADAHALLTRSAGPTSPSEPLTWLRQRHAEVAFIQALPLSEALQHSTACTPGCWIMRPAPQGPRDHAVARHAVYLRPDRPARRLIVVGLPADALRDVLARGSVGDSVASLIDGHRDIRLLRADAAGEGRSMQASLDPQRTPDQTRVRQLFRGETDAPAHAWSRQQSMMVRYHAAGVPGSGWRVLLTEPQQNEWLPAYRLAIRQSLIQLAAVALLALVLYLYLRRSLAPLGLLGEAADDLALGRFDTPLPRTSHPDEIGRVTAAFGNMRDRLRDSAAELERSSAIRHSQQSTMDVARQIQTAMLPSTSRVVADVPGIDIAASLMPQREVGGDFYSFFAIGEQLFFMIGDVADKGVPAALLMARTTSLAQALAPHMPKPDDLLAAINDEIARGNHACMFVTMLCGLLDTVTGRLVIASAGHEAAICLNPRGQAEWLLPDDSGPALGLYDDAYYPSTEVQLQPGQMLLLYTDGITEAEDPQGQHFGEDALLGSLSVEALSSADDVIARTVDAVKSHASGAHQSDDMALLCVRWMPPDRIQTVDIANRISEMVIALNWLEDIAIVLQVSVDTALTLRLVAEELLSNTLRYGYGDRRDGRINMTLYRHARSLTLRISDDANAFDPSLRPSRPPSRNDAERSEGGEGLTLVHALAQAIRYYPKLHGNIVEVDFDLSPDGPA